MKKKSKEVKEVERDSAFEIPEWHIELGKEELKNIANGTADLMDWEFAKKK